MENFKTVFLGFCLTFVLLMGCDPLYDLRTPPVSWRLQHPTTSALHVIGADNSTLTTLSITRKGMLKSEKLLLMTNAQLVDSIILAKLYAHPLDSLKNNPYIFDTVDNGFYPLSYIVFAEGQVDTNFLLQRPISHKHVYIYGFTNTPPSDIQIVLQFNKLGDKTTPLIELVSIK